MKYEDRDGEINDNRELMRDNAKHTIRAIDRSNCVERVRLAVQLGPFVYMDTSGQQLIELPFVVPSGIYRFDDGDV